MKDRRIGIPRGDREVRRPAGEGGRRAGPDRRSVDNVPGVPGIGVKTAAQLIDEYGDLDTLLARAGEIKQPKRRETLIENADQARLSRSWSRSTPTCRSTAARRPRGARPRPQAPDRLPQGDGVHTLTRRVAEFSGLDAGADRGGRQAHGGRAAHRRGDGCGAGAASSRCPPAFAASTGGSSGTETARVQPQQDARQASIRRSRSPPRALPPLTMPKSTLALRGVRRLERLDAWIARAPEPGMVAFDTETTASTPCRRRCAASRWRSARTKPATSRSPTSRRRRRQRRPVRRPALRPIRSRSAPRSPPQAAARGPRRPQGRPEPQVRHAVFALAASSSRPSTTPC